MEKNKEQEILFAKTLEEVKQKAKQQGNTIERETVEVAFSAMELSKEQLEMVFSYLENYKIGIGEPVDLDNFLTGEDGDYLAVYEQELSELPQYSAGEKEAFLLSAMAGEKSAKGKVIECFLNEVMEIAKLYAGQGVFLEDLIGEGNVALTIGVEMAGSMESPEEAKGLLIRMVMDAMETLIAAQVQAGEADKEMVANVNVIFEQSKALAESLLRKVTKEELAAETGRELAEIEEAICFSGGHMDYIEVDTDETK